MSSTLVTYANMQNPDAVDPDCLSPTERRRLSDIGAPGRRRQFMCGRSLLRHSLERWTGEPAASHRLTTTEVGKPICIDGPSLSITHSGDLVVCAVTGSGRIGIDLEIPNGRRKTSAIARSYFSSEEADWLETQPENRFYMLWVLKEAHGKAIGSGLSGLNSLHCMVYPPRIEAKKTDDSGEGLGLYGLGDAFLALAVRHESLQDLAIEPWRTAQATPPYKFWTIATTHDLT